MTEKLIPDYRLIDGFDTTWDSLKSIWLLIGLMLRCVIGSVMLLVFLGCSEETILSLDTYIRPVLLQGA